MDVTWIPVAVPDFDARLRLMFDLLAVAYQTNMTRIATFMMAAEVSNTPYPHVGVPDAFHPLSHHAENKQSMEKLTIVQRYHSEVFVGFLEKLAHDARRRCGIDARQLDIPVRQQHEQQQQARFVPVADARVRPRWRDQRPATLALRRPHAASPICCSR